MYIYNIYMRGTNSLDETFGRAPKISGPFTTSIIMSWYVLCADLSMSYVQTLARLMSRF